MLEHPLTLRMAGVDDAALLAQMNLRLIQDEGSNNPMDAEQLEVRMRQFLQYDWSCAILELPDAVVVIDVLSANQRGEGFWRSVGFLPYATTMHKYNEQGGAAP